MNKLLTKSIAWSYPTSPNADRFGFPKGCYTLELTDPAGIIPPQPLKGYATEAEGLAAAHKLPQPWDRLFLKFEHPEFASTSQGDEETSGSTGAANLLGSQANAGAHYAKPGGTFSPSDADSGL